MEQTLAWYNWLAPLYDLIARGEKEAIDAGIRLLNVQEGERVLELGCGTGRALPSLYRSIGPGGMVIGLDIAESMLTLARGKKELQFSRIELIRGDTRILPLRDRSVDAMLMTFTLELFPIEEILLVLEECERVLTWQGRLTVVSLAEGNNIAVKLYRLMRRLVPDILDCRPIPLEEIILKRGFRILSRERVCLWGLPVAIVAAAKRSNINRHERQVGV